MDFLASHGFDFNKFVYEVSTRAMPHVTCPNI